MQAGEGRGGDSKEGGGPADDDDDEFAPTHPHAPVSVNGGGKLLI